MKDKVKLLHQLRQDKAEDQARLDKSWADWLDANQEDNQRKVDIAKQINELEKTAKAQRVEMYDGEDKSKMIGVGIRVSDKPDYIHDNAFAWAMEKKLALSLNEDTDDSGDSSMWEGERSPIDYDDLP